MKNRFSTENNTGSIFKTLVLLAIPTILEEVFSTLLQYVDTAMVGNLGENATAAVSGTTTINWLINSFPYAIGIGSIALISQAFGSKQKQLLKNYSKAILFLATIIGAVIGTASIIISPFIPRWMGIQAEIQKEASLYFLIISIPMIFRSFIIILGSAIRAVADTRTPMIITIIENIMNIFLNYILIYSANLKVLGAAIASAISFTLSGTLMLIAFCKNKELGLNFNKINLYFKKNKTKSHKKSIQLQKDSDIFQHSDLFSKFKEDIFFVIKKSFPVLMAHVSSCLAYVIFTSLVCKMGTITFAAHSIAITIETLFYIPGYGLRTACSTLVGISIGEKNQQKFKKTCIEGVLISLLMMSVTGALLYLTNYQLMNLMTSSLEVAKLGSEMLKIVAFSEPFFGLMIVCEGILYGQGRTKLPFIGELITMWGIRVLFTFLCTNIWHLDLKAVWICMIACNVAKTIFFATPLIFINKDWKKLMQKKAV